MDALLTARLRRGLSQRALAGRAGLSFRGVQLLETPGHDARITSLSKVAKALGHAGVERLLESFFLEDVDSFRSASLRMLVDGFDSWIVHLFDAVDAFRRSPDEELVRTPPVADLDPRLCAVLASTVEVLCRDAALVVPPWTLGVPALPAPWFVAGIENLKASALVESPAAYRKRNVFVLANFLERA